MAASGASFLQRLGERLRPRSAGLRAWLGLSYGLLAIALVGVLSVLVESAASDKLEEDIGLRLAGNAVALADRMDEGLYERLNDMRTMSLLPGIADPAANQDSLRAMFDMMQLTYPDYAWIGITGADGQVRVASRGLLEGVSMSERPWFKAGLREPFVGDIRDAVLLQKYIQPSGDGPLRLIDVAAPVHDDFGVVVGVMGAHLSWDWAERLRQDLMESLVAHDPVEVFVLNADGVVVLGPKGWRDQAVALDSFAQSRARSSGFVLEDWPDGRAYLTGFAKTRGRPLFDSLGWVVLVRMDADVAFAPVSELGRQIWLVSGALTLVFLLVAFVLARQIGQPLQALANAARRIQAGDPEAGFPRERGYREARELTGALRALVEELTTHERELTALTQQLEQRVRERTVELSDANAQLEVLAMTDGLTGLANRRHFGDQLAREVTRCAEKGKPLALVTMDIDHFKAINDTYGHPAGDAVLRRVAMLLEEQVRGGDLLARVGGEEFAVLALETPMSEALPLAERLRAAIEGAGPIAVGRDAVPVTISLGVAVLWSRQGDLLKAPERLLAAADDALYRAKRNGRNRVEVAAP
ncbi:MAG TPA: diguanylate cyclase [Arenimonas sp.]|uniref:sensor domain-containing diguanylate cyclase n=1 Tax=Arenimonas sp. TaxID=1872635 RepID=UPI002D7F5C61|nr:diguanylate cyclase [Arenimonas sp.]HEU0152295.1 diguanylate cyclase [Arenimonas sp.]